jgi:ParB-like chromosome segregation protein Spo0J
MQPKNSTRLVDVESITVPTKRRRGSRPIEALAESMGSVGLINPITLTEELVLIAGWHRLKAASHSAGPR